jgi:hypothetical protein
MPYRGLSSYNGRSISEFDFDSGSDSGSGSDSRSEIVLGSGSGSGADFEPVAEPACNPSFRGRRSSHGCHTSCCIDRISRSDVRHEEHCLMVDHRSFRPYPLARLADLRCPFHGIEASSRIGVYVERLVILGKQSYKEVLTSS